jgi:hypothetical protein
MDISNNQRNLFGVIERSYLLNGEEGKPHEDGIMTMNYTDRVQANSYANYPHQSYSQLDGGINIGTFGKGNSQPSKLPKPTIDCTPRKNETSSRFNYAFDNEIDNRNIDISGQYIPNNKLRVMPNRGIELCYQNRIIPDNREILQLSQRLGNISGMDKSFKLSPSDLRYKIQNQKLTREELTNLVTKVGKTYEGNSGILGIPNMSPQVNNWSGVISALRQNKSIAINRSDGGYLDLANQTTVKKSSQRIDSDLSELFRFAAESNKNKKIDAANTIKSALIKGNYKKRPKKNP